MIRYDSGAWLTLFYWWGGVNREILGPATIYLVLLVFFFYIQSHLQFTVHVSHSSLQSLVGFLVFLLVFRLNQCMARHEQGEGRAVKLFACLENIITTSCSSLRGGDCTDGEDRDTYDELAILAKVNIVRTTLAFAITWIMQAIVLDASSEQEGELGEVEMQSMVFLYCRLQSLLYAEEMEVVERSICIFCEHSDPRTPRSSTRRSHRSSRESQRRGASLPNGLQPQSCTGDSENRDDDCVYRVEVVRHRLKGDPAKDEPVIGRAVIDDDRDTCEGVTVSPVYKAMTILLDSAVRDPSDQPWGYTLRVMTQITSRLSEATQIISSLNTLIAAPTPLPYLQHCRVLLIIFAVLYPLSIDSSLGWMDNVVMPFVIFWSMLGFEVLAEMAENPFGADPSDINVMEFIHELECQAQQAFETTEEHRQRLRTARIRPCRDFGLRKAATALEMKMPQGTNDNPDARTHRALHAFDTYFTWLPIPSLVLGNLMESHGEVTILHEAYFQQHDNFRQLLRTSLRRNQRNLVSGASASSYQALSQDEPMEVAGGTSDDDRARFNGVSPELVRSVQKDPKFFCHYLVFNATHKGRQQQDVERWIRKAQDKLKKHPASSLLGVVQEDDSVRSVARLTAFQSSSESSQECDHPFGNA